MLVCRPFYHQQFSVGGMRAHLASLHVIVADLKDPEVQGVRSVLREEIYVGNIKIPPFLMCNSLSIFIVGLHLVI